MSVTATPITPEAVQAFKTPTTEFLCPVTANSFGLDFLSYSITDSETNSTLFSIERDPNAPPPRYPPGFDFDDLRRVKYTFPKSFLDSSKVKTRLTFRSAKPIKNLRMIELHFCGDTLVKRFDFTHPGCEAGPITAWETAYEMPTLSPELRSRIEAGGFEDNRADSFYFVDGTLVMHNKAFFTYADDAAAPAAASTQQ